MSAPRGGSSPESGVVPELHEVDCPPELRERIEASMAKYPEIRSASIPALWHVQEHYGWCTPEGIRQAAAVMGLTPAYLESVASFYDMLKLEPAGEHTVMVCTNLSCWMRGGDELLDAFLQACDADEKGRSPDRAIQVDGFECLGACDVAPMASIDRHYYGPLDVADARSAVEQIRSGADVLPGKRVTARRLAGGEVDEVDPRVAAGEPGGAGSAGEHPGQPADSAERDET